MRKLCALVAKAAKRGRRCRALRYARQKPRDDAGIQRDSRRESDGFLQLRSGALQLSTLDGGILQSVVPVAAIESIGFAFHDSADAFRAFDGPLGD